MIRSRNPHTNVGNGDDRACGYYWANCRRDDLQLNIKNIILRNVPEPVAFSAAGHSCFAGTSNTKIVNH
jgi:hypothetical protein